MAAHRPGRRGRKQGVRRGSGAKDVLLLGGTENRDLQQIHGEEIRKRERGGFQQGPVGNVVWQGGLRTLHRCHLGSDSPGSCRLGSGSRVQVNSAASASAPEPPTSFSF